jgi:hypothetical protein
MNPEYTLSQVRRFLLIISAGVFLMTVLELVFLGHWSIPIQFLPFALSGLGLVTLALAYLRPGRGSLTTMRLSMILIGACSLIGFYEHMANNYTFQIEIQPGASTLELILATFEGANPVLAPGILLFGAVLGLLATYRDTRLSIGQRL